MSVLLAVIKKSSKYAHQQPRDAQGRAVPFLVTIVDDRSYPVRGNDNNYRIGDLNFMALVGDGFVRLS